MSKEEEVKKEIEGKLNSLNPYKDRVSRLFYIDENGKKTAKNKRERLKITKISRDALTWALEGHSTKIRMALDKLFDESPEAYISAITKLLNYTVPKLTSSEITDTTTKKVKIDLNDDVSIEALREKLNDIDNN